MMDVWNTWDDGAIDAWPEGGVGVWPKREEAGPLLPPLPSAQPAGTELGWVLEWPVAWLGDAAIESWGHWAARPRRQPIRRAGIQRAAMRRLPQRRSPRPGVARRYGHAYARIRRRRAGNRLVMLATLALVGALAVLTVGHGFPALAERLDALRNGASSLGDGIGNDVGSGLSGGLGNVPGIAGSTASPVPTPPLAPAIGSDAREFAAFFAAAAPTAPGAVAHYHVVMSGVSVSLDVTSGVGTDHRDRIATVVAGAAALAGWDSPTADAICAAFLPPDAQLQGVSHVAADTEYRYASANLAASFPQADFVDDGYGLLPPGTLTRLDAPPLGSASGVGSCTVSLGAH